MGRQLLPPRRHCLWKGKIGGWLLSSRKHLCWMGEVRRQVRSAFYQEDSSWEGVVLGLEEVTLPSNLKGTAFALK
jgi:hypothetical protein